MTKLTVIIPTYRGSAWIRACIESVRSSRDIHPRIVIFDNASTDDTRGIVTREFPDVELIAHPTNIGFARANNVVMLQAIRRGDDYVFLLNEDTRIDPDTLSTLVTVAEEQDVAMLSPLQYDYDGRAFESDFASLVAQAGLKEGWEDQAFVSTRRLIGAAMLMRLSAIREIGLFDPAYFLYAEEEDLCRRARHAGFRIGLTPRARIYHDHRPTGDMWRLARERRFQMLRGRYILALKNPAQSLPRAMVTLAHLVFRDLVAVLVRRDATALGDSLAALGKAIASLDRICRRRRLEREHSEALWRAEETGVGALVTQTSSPNRGVVED
jgi:GT2 family glycosyltransferase